jgi:cytochrome b561
MRETIVSTMTAMVNPRTEPEKFGIVAIVLHWIVAILILLAAVSGLVTSNTNDATLTRQSLALHQSIGIVVFALSAIRAGWRLTHAAPMLPATTPHYQRWAATATHVALYFMLFALPVTGYVSLAARGRTISLLGLVLPNWAPLSLQLAAQAKFIHATSQYVLYALLVLHVGAALYHRFVMNDGILERMWPGRREAA